MPQKYTFFFIHERNTMKKNDHLTDMTKNNKWFEE